VFAALGLCVAVSLAGACARVAEAPSPNVLLVTFDALRQDHVSHLGYERPTTPNVDALASRGITWTNLIPSSCSTKASLTSLLTSLDYASHRLIEHEAVLDDGFVTLAEAFRDHGYRTFGSVATPHLSKALGYDQGFDRYTDYLAFNDVAVGADLVIDRLLGDLADRPSADERPFFAYLHFEEPHPPWLHDSPWIRSGTEATRFFGEGCGYVPSLAELKAVTEEERYDLVAKYDGAVRFADEQLGRLIESLRQSGELSRTVIAISADHGLELLDRYSASHGFNPHDEVVRGFLILYDGRHERSAAQIIDDVQGRIFDVGPTLLAAAGLEPIEDVDGLDLVSRSDELPEYAYSTCYGFESVRSLRWKLVSYRYKTAKKWYREVRRPLGMPDSVRLFDLAADPGETIDVGGEHRELLNALFRDLKRYRARPRILDAPVRVLDKSQRSAQEVARLRALGYL